MNKILFFISLGFIFFLILAGIKNIKWEGVTLEFTRKSSLTESIDKALEGSTGTYSVAIKNLKTGEEYYKDEEKTFDSGSLYKVWTLLSALRQIEKGELKEDEIISGNIENINKALGQTSDEAELKSGEIDFTIREAMRQMITISHNYAAVLLTEKVGVENVQNEINSIGLKNTIINTQDRPKTTAKDILILFEKIYKKEGISAWILHEALELLFNQELNDRIPKYLPKEARVAHKTGEIDFQKHDAGIVFTPNGDYIIVVLSESDNPTAASDRIATISKNVYEYFNKKN